MNILNERLRLKASWRAHSVDAVMCLSAPSSVKNSLPHCWECCLQKGFQLSVPSGFASAAETPFPLSPGSVIDQCRAVKAWQGQPTQNNSEDPFHYISTVPKGLDEAVIGPASQLDFSLCPLLPSSPPFPNCQTQGHSLINILCTRLCLRVNLLGNSV